MGSTDLALRGTSVQTRLPIPRRIAARTARIMGAIGVGTLLGVLPAGCGAKTGLEVGEAPTPRCSAISPTISDTIVSNHGGALDTAYVSLAWNSRAREYGFSWAGMVPPARASIVYFNRVSEDGRLLGPTTNVSSNNNNVTAMSSAITWDDDRYGISWSGSNNRLGGSSIFFRSLFDTGLPASPEIEIGQGDFPSLAWNNRDGVHGISWTDTTASLTTRPLSFRRVRPDNSLVGREIHITGRDFTGNSSLVWTGENFAVSWSENTDTVEGPKKILFALLTSDGNPIGTPLQLRNNSEGHYSGSPSLAWNGFGFGLSWRDWTTSPSSGDRIPPDAIYFQRISPDGRLIGSETRVVVENADISGRLSLVWAGDRYGLTWMGIESSDTEDFATMVYFQLIAADGTPIGENLNVTRRIGYGPFPRDADNSFAFDVSSVWTGQGFGVGWRWANATRMSEIHLTRVTCQP